MEPLLRLRQLWHRGDQGDQVDVYTTYHAPATNITANQLVHTIAPNTTVGTNATALNPVEYSNCKTPFDTPPAGSGGDLLPVYYNDFLATDTDGKINCVAKDEETR